MIETATAEILQQQDRLMFVVAQRDARPAAALAPRVYLAATTLELRDILGQLPARAARPLMRFENATAQELRDIRQLIARQPQQEPARLAFIRVRYTRTQGTNQDGSHNRTPAR